MNYLFFFLLFFILIVISFEQTSNYCNINKNCNNCSICGKDNNDYCSCNMDNMYCYNGEPGNYTSISNFLYSFDGCIIGNGDLEDVCGSSNINIDIGTNKTINFVSTSMGDYFCYYNVAKTKNNNNEIIISLKRDGNTPQALNMHLLVYDNNNKIRLSSYKNLLYSSNFFEIVELYAEKISVYIHIFNGNNMGNISISFSIKGTIIKKIIYTTDSTINKALIFGIIGGALFILLIIIIICLVKKYRRRRVPQIIETYSSNNLKARTPSYLEQVNKNTAEMKLLFRTELSPTKYNKQKALNDCYNCTICLEDFKDQLDIIVTTKCKHSFHFNCFKNWVFKNIIFPKCPNCNNPILNSDSINKYTMSTI